MSEALTPLLLEIEDSSTPTRFETTFRWGWYGSRRALMMLADHRLKRTETVGGWPTREAAAADEDG